MKTKRFRELVGVAAGFIFLLAILLIERVGILYEGAASDVMMVPDDQIMYIKEAPSKKVCLLIWNSGDANSEKAKNLYDQVLADLRVPTDIYDMADESNSSLKDILWKYKTVVITMGDLRAIDKQILDVNKWVGNGGRLLFGVPPFRSELFDFFSSKIGVISAEYEYEVVDSFHSEDFFMLGAQRDYPIIDGYESAIGVVLDDECKIYATTADGKVPLVWTRDYQDGRFVVCNFGYTEKAYRGIFSSAYSLLEDVFIYPVINASTFYIDDFPSPVPSGDGQYVKRDYNMNVSDFYSRVWWPDMLALGREHDIKYTGLIIETYRNQTGGELPSNDSTSNYYYYGNMLLGQGGELGYHGYNHQPLCTESFEYNKDMGYEKWEDYDAMKDSIKELIRFAGSIFPKEEMSVYVPPSNVLSEEGRQLLGLNFPQIKVIASIYPEGSDEYVQEFSVSEDGIIETPRVVSGGVLDDYMRISAFSELNFHYVSSHFLHPDDLLDEDRGADLGWEELKRRLDDYMGWVDDSAKEIRHLTGSGMAGAVQRYVNLVPDYYMDKDKNVILSTKGLIDTGYYMIRVNDGEIGDAYGGDLFKLNDTLYLLKAQSKRITITRR